MTARPQWAGGAGRLARSWWWFSMEPFGSGWGGLVPGGVLLRVATYQEAQLLKLSLAYRIRHWILRWVARPTRRLLLIALAQASTSHLLSPRQGYPRGSLIPPTHLPLAREASMMSSAARRSTRPDGPGLTREARASLRKIAKPA